MRTVRRPDSLEPPRRRAGERVTARGPWTRGSLRSASPFVLIEVVGNGTPYRSYRDARDRSDLEPEGARRVSRPRGPPLGSCWDSRYPFLVRGGRPPLDRGGRLPRGTRRFYGARSDLGLRRRRRRAGFGRRGSCPSLHDRLPEVSSERLGVGDRRMMVSGPVLSGFVDRQDTRRPDSVRTLLRGTVSTEVSNPTNDTARRTGACDGGPIVPEPEGNARGIFPGHCCAVQRHREPTARPRAKHASSG